MKSRLNNALRYNMSNSFNKKDKNHKNKDIKSKNKESMFQDYDKLKNNKRVYF